MRESRLLSCLAGVLLGLALTSCTRIAMPPQPALQADIRWTSHGIPHISARDERGLGYGIGYAYARDNACLLADEIVTVRGERARYFGAEGRSSAQLDNLTSDFFFTWLNDAASLQAFGDAQPAPVRQLLEGYVAGFNRFLRETDGQGVSCQGEPWLHAIEVDDLLRLTRRLLVEGGLGQFAEALMSAAPPGQAALAADAASLAMASERRERMRFDKGSNAIAVGRQRSPDGKGMLLANPHFPWFGGLRFYQMHLTIPGQLDVMGGALPGLPLINIGFNRHLAWTHTVDTSSHFTLYRLQLDPQNPLHYRVDGQSRPLRKKTLSIRVRNDAGELSTLERDIYESSHGPLLNWPGMLDWDENQAYALRDANLDNTRVLLQWYEINQASDVAGLRRVVERLQGIPWVNTLAADAKGNALYMNQSVVPYLTGEQLQGCVIVELAERGLPALRGDTAECIWRVDPRAAQAGITPAEELPVLEREDYVQNSNDSAWLTNPDVPLQGYSPLVSREGRTLGLRARFALQHLQGDQALTADDLVRLVKDNRVYLFDLLRDDLAALCARERDGALEQACAALADWDGAANVGSGMGMLLFQHFSARFLALDGAWRVPFDSAAPLSTPRGLNPSDPRMRDALREAAGEVAALGIDDGRDWGAVQISSRGAERLAVPGGYGELGIYNAIQSRPVEQHLEVVGGSSYIQMVTFTEKGPLVRGLLAFSQSADPASSHHADQTRLFSQQEWPLIPYSDEQIEADLRQRLLIQE
ncbi:acylase [Pseudomonas mendocina]|nr:acylase [Pseudomonas mendocina]MBH3339904.1 acylase [Pseudomonas mendocina]